MTAGRGGGNRLFVSSVNPPLFVPVLFEDAKLLQFKMKMTSFVRQLVHFTILLSLKTSPIPKVIDVKHSNWTELFQL